MFNLLSDMDWINFFSYIRSFVSTRGLPDEVSKSFIGFKCHRKKIDEIAIPFNQHNPLKVRFLLNREPFFYNLPLKIEILDPCYAVWDFFGIDDILVDFLRQGGVECGSYSKFKEHIEQIKTSFVAASYCPWFREKYGNSLILKKNISTSKAVNISPSLHYGKTQAIHEYMKAMEQEVEPFLMTVEFEMRSVVDTDSKYFVANYRSDGC